MSIRLKLTLWHAALLALVLAAFAVAVYLVIARQLTTEMDYAVHLKALDASRTAHYLSLATANPRVHRLELPSTIPSADGAVYVQLLGVDGRVLASSSNLPQPLPTPPENVRSALNGQEAHITISLPGERMDLYSTPLLMDDQIVGLVQVAASLRPLETSLAQLRLVLAATVFGAALLAAVTGWFLATRAMEPVDRLTQTAHQIGRSADLSRRLPEPRQRDELQRLATTFNDLLGRLDETLAAQRRFLADASHELRTPLTAINTNVEALLRGAAEDPEERADVLGAIARETRRMGRLVADLLTLARADAGHRLERRRVALDTLLLEVYHQEKRLAHGVRLTLGDLEQVEVDGDPDRLKQLLLNLVDNALRYTPEGGQVTLALTQRHGWALMRVADTGVGVPADQLSRIFERFYRGDHPRSRRAGGTGLGLSICQWIAEAHGGRIEVESGVGIGSTFTVLLPACTGAGGAIPPCPPGPGRQTLTPA